MSLLLLILSYCLRSYQRQSNMSLLSQSKVSQPVPIEMVVIWGFPKGIAAEVGTIWGWQQVEGMLRYSLQIILAFYLNLSGFARKQFTTDSIINFNCQNVFFF